MNIVVVCNWNVGKVLTFHDAVCKRHIGMNISFQYNVVIFYCWQFVLSNCEGKRRKFYETVCTVCISDSSDCFEKGSTNIVEIAETMRKYMKSYLMWNFQNVNFMFYLSKIIFFINVFFLLVVTVLFYNQGLEWLWEHEKKKKKQDTCWTWFRDVYMKYSSCLKS